MHRRGISLVELLLVIAIIGVLMSLLLPAVMAVRQRVLLLECMANAKNIVGAAHSYGAARKGALPHLGWFHYNLLTYLEGSTYYGKTGDDLPKKKQRLYSNLPVSVGSHARNVRFQFGNRDLLCSERRSLGRYTLPQNDVQGWFIEHGAARRALCVLESVGA